MNRGQNASVVSECRAPAWKCLEVRRRMENFALYDFSSLAAWTALKNALPKLWWTFKQKEPSSSISLSPLCFVPGLDGRYLFNLFCFPRSHLANGKLLFYISTGLIHCLFGKGSSMKDDRIILVPFNPLLPVVRKSTQPPLHSFSSYHVCFWPFLLSPQSGQPL